MDERWTSVPGYVGLYEISDLGRLRRIATPTGKPHSRLIAPHIKRTGYADYWLWSGGRNLRVCAHRLVWRSFNGEIAAKLQINHINGVKSDNRLSNLELATPSWNAAHSFRVLGRPAPNNPSHGEKNGSAVLTVEKVREIRAIYGSKQLNQYQLAAKFGVSQRTINLVVRRLTWATV